VWAQDRACTEGMGAIMDRTQEHLASSDLPVIKMRRLLIRVARQLEAAGTEPPGVRTVPRVAAIPTGLYQRDLPWEQVAAAVTEQIRPDERKLQCRQ
jgi:phthalate 4,5-dioxygenase oxygenase subunit